MKIFAGRIIKSIGALGAGLSLGLGTPAQANDASIGLYFDLGHMGGYYDIHASPRNHYRHGHHPGKHYRKYYRKHYGSDYHHQGHPHWRGHSYYRPHRDWYRSDHHHKHRYMHRQEIHGFNHPRHTYREPHRYHHEKYRHGQSPRSRQH